ncbi:beta-casein (DUF760) [Wolffia australiana]
MRVGDGVVVLPQPPAVGGGLRPPLAELRLWSFALSSDSRRIFSLKRCSSLCWPRVGILQRNPLARRFKLKASEKLGESQDPIAPLQLESPAGQLLSQILRTHPHLFSAAIDQQLQLLQSEEDDMKAKSSAAPEDILYRRIAEVKSKERNRAVEEIFYCLVVQKFVEKEIAMIPPISPAPEAVAVDTWPNQDRKLESVHSSDALEMIESHISLVLGDRSVGPLSSVAQISKIKLGKLYAASIMYGYFLKRVDERFQLERSMNMLPPRTRDRRIATEDLPTSPFWDVEDIIQIPAENEDEDNDVDSDLSRLRSYVMYLDPETLQKYATMRSKAAMSLIEKQTQALFGRPDIRLADDGSVAVPNDEVVSISFSGLSSLVLEAVAFGAFLWDSESFLDSRYRFLSS